MKSTSSCDVEISITMDGMETVELVPECLQEAFLCTSTRHTTYTTENDVILPERYRQLISGVNVDEREKRNNVDDKLTERERDIGKALDWIKQEIGIMKEQDKDLMKQFVTLRSKIFQLRCISEIHSSSSDLDLSLDDSIVSLDDTIDSPDYPDTSSETEGDFRFRTSSLLVPKCPCSSVPVTRIRWKSNEYL